ncbi:MAG: DUF3267 domain-containing protein [Eggerthia catenaformis]|uniref:DUF3267 domain-containing protein n=1 Tax=Eggerthia catenaformis TaxID=31973 RepID=UPI00047AAD1C|nr:DUF3267 domain-containing protein [Eggerthia catenaformis]
MANIIWEGNRKEFGTSHQSPPVSKNAIKILDSEGIIGKSLSFGILPMLMCMAAVVIKAYINREVPFSYVYIIPAIVIGFIVALPLHEFAHAICYPKGATVWVGLCLRKVAAYAISYHPLTKKRFIIMSLAPAVLGIIPLIGFILIPITMKPLLTICMVLAYMGLISPAPDYMGIVSVLMKAPPYALICDTQDGLYAYVKRAK